MSEAIGFIGLGMMGVPMARRLVAHGHRLVVHDLREDAVAAITALGAERAVSPAAMAARVGTVLLSLPTLDAAREVARDLAATAGDRALETVVDLSTTGPEVAVEVAATLAEAGITLVDAPVSGGVAGAEAGTLSVMLSGPAAVCDALTPTLEVIGGNVFRVGALPGQGQLMKLINNLLSATALAASCEAAVLGVKGGLDPQVMMDVLNVSTGRNSATQDKIPRRVIPRTFDAGFRTELQYKDVRLCLEQAERLGVPMWVGQAVGQIWRFAMSQGGGPGDVTEIVKLMEGWAGVTVGGDGRDAR